MHGGGLYQVALLSGSTYVINGPIGVICNFPKLENVLHVLAQSGICYILEGLLIYRTRFDRD